LIIGNYVSALSPFFLKKKSKVHSTFSEVTQKHFFYLNDYSKKKKTLDQMNVPIFFFSSEE